MNNEQYRQELNNLLTSEFGNVNPEFIDKLVELTDKRGRLFQTKKNLLKALKAHKCPSTWASVRLLEENDLLPIPANSLDFHRKDSPIQFSRVMTAEGEAKVESKRAGMYVSKQYMPIYTQEEIDNIVEIMIGIQKKKEEERRAKQQENY